ncbi:nucleotidyltransferase domain-containing protein [Metabacillus litoralis]|uniref:Nucleotidyltransferase domain-containing protein n=1 Tax=Metabacillus litoralis TaxID=152268 RepID=A0A5C6W0Z7_9BACI|nr:nucleotidyltransferase domain-containing protein [Metabacillus litoralis]
MLEENRLESRIRIKLQGLEKNHNIRILYACEAGSRAWGISSPNSDYDVRFVYTHQENWYLQLYEGKDVIEYTCEENRLELNGWDIKKTLKLLNKSNPSLFEWLQSPITYCIDEVFFNQLIDLTSKAFSPDIALYHYLNIAKQNNKLLMKKPTTKGYLATLKPIISCQWIIQHRNIPPFGDRMLFFHYIEDNLIEDQIELLLKKKQVGVKQFSSYLLDNYICITLERIENCLKKPIKNSYHLTDQLTKLFISTVKGF